MSDQVLTNDQYRAKVFELVAGAKFDELAHADRQRRLLARLAWKQRRRVAELEASVVSLVAAARRQVGNCRSCNGRGERGGDPELGGLPCGACADLRDALARLGG